MKLAFTLITNTEALNNNKLKYFLNLILIGSLCLLSCENKKNSSLSMMSGEEKEVNEKHDNLENTKRKISLNEFIKWYGNTENHLRKSKDISELRYTLSYMPAENMAFLELRSEQYDYSRFQKTCESYSELTYFNLKIELPNGSGELIKHNLQTAAQYDSRVKYTSFEMQNDIYLIQGNDTLRPGLYQCERIFEVAPYLTASIAFDNEKFDKTKGLTIVFNDRLFEKGFIKFNYTNGQLIDVPTITEL